MSFGFPPRSNTNQAVIQWKIAIALKFRIKAEEKYAKIRTETIRTRNVQSMQRKQRR